VVLVGADPAPAANWSPPAEPVDGGRAGWFPDDSTLVVYDLDGAHVRIAVLGGAGWEDAELVAAGLRRPPTADPDRPDTWSPDLTG
jgi:hypothetical protein